MSFQDSPNEEARASRVDSTASLSQSARVSQVRSPLCKPSSQRLETTKKVVIAKLATPETTTTQRRGQQDLRVEPQQSLSRNVNDQPVSPGATFHPRLQTQDGSAAQSLSHTYNALLPETSIKASSIGHGHQQTATHHELPRMNDAAVGQPPHDSLPIDCRNVWVAKELDSNPSDVSSHAEAKSRDPGPQDRKPSVTKHCTPVMSEYEASDQYSLNESGSRQHEEAACENGEVALTGSAGSQASKLRRKVSLAESDLLNAAFGFQNTHGASLPGRSDNQRRSNVCGSLGKMSSMEGFSDHTSNFGILHGFDTSRGSTIHPQKSFGATRNAFCS